MTLSNPAQPTPALHRLMGRGHRRAWRHEADRLAVPAAWGLAGAAALAAAAALAGLDGAPWVALGASVLVLAGTAGLLARRRPSDRRVARDLDAALETKGLFTAARDVHRPRRGAPPGGSALVLARAEAWAARPGLVLPPPPRRGHLALLAPAALGLGGLFLALTPADPGPAPVLETPTAPATVSLATDAEGAMDALRRALRTEQTLLRDLGGGAAAGGPAPAGAAKADTASSPAEADGAAAGIVAGSSDTDSAGRGLAPSDGAAPAPTANASGPAGDPRPAPAQGSADGAAPLVDGAASAAVADPASAAGRNGGPDLPLTPAERAFADRLLALESAPR